MFRRLPNTLPDDPSWDADLIKLGYLINQHSQVRQIREPSERFKYKVTNNYRFNVVHKEAFHKCLRKEIGKRMVQLELPPLYLPQMLATKPKEPSVPILMMRPEVLKTKKNIIVIVNDHHQDLGVWAWRKICDDDFDAGSSTGTVKMLKSHYHGTGSEPGLVILNTGQSYYSYKEKRALTHESWEAMPRKSLCHPTVRAHPTFNLVHGSRTALEHVATVFEKVINNKEYVDPDTELYLIGICGAGNTLTKYLNKTWSTMSKRVKAVAWTDPHLQTAGLKPELIHFLETRTRAWMLSSTPLGTCIGLPDHTRKPKRPPISPAAPREWGDQDDDAWEEELACPAFSSEEPDHSECIFPRVQKAMMEFFSEVEKGGDGYVNPKFEVVKPLKPDEDELDGDVEGEDGIQGKEFDVRDVNEQGDLLPPGDAEVETVTKEVKEVQLADDEVEVAGVAVAKDLLAKADLV